MRVAVKKEITQGKALPFLDGLFYSDNTTLRISCLLLFSFFIARLQYSKQIVTGYSLLCIVLVVHSAPNDYCYIHSMSELNKSRVIFFFVFFLGMSKKQAVAKDVSVSHCVLNRVATPMVHMFPLETHKTSGPLLSVYNSKPAS